MAFSAKFFATESTQHSLDAGNHFARTEGLANIIVRAEFEPEETVNFLYPCSDHDDGDRRKGPQLSAHLHAVLAWEHQVEQDKSGGVVLHPGHDLEPMCHAVDHVSSLSEIIS